MRKKKINNSLHIYISITVALVLLLALFNFLRLPPITRAPQIENKISEDASDIDLELKKTDGEINALNPDDFDTSLLSDPAMGY